MRLTKIRVRNASARLRQKKLKVFMERQKKSTAARSVQRLWPEMSAFKTARASIRKDLRVFNLEMKKLVAEQEALVQQMGSVADNRMLELRMEALKKIIQAKRIQLKLAQEVQAAEEVREGDKVPSSVRLH